MRLLVLLLLLVGSAPAAAYTIDFEAASGFVVGQAPPATYPTPWGDVEFTGSSVIAEDPLHPGSQMLSPVVGSYDFQILLPPGIYDPEFLMVNPGEVQVWVGYFPLVWRNCSGSPCFDYENDKGGDLQAESKKVWVFREGRDGFGSGGVDFYSGAHEDFDQSRGCTEVADGCYFEWGIASISWVPEPATGLLVSLGLVGLGARHTARCRRLQNAHFSPS